MMNDLAQVQLGTTIRNDWDVPYLFGEEILEARTIYADSLFFRVFDIPFRMGDPGEALTPVNSAVISASFAKKAFSRTDVVGETLHMRGDRYLNITGVIADWPQNSRFDAEVIVSFLTLRDENRLYMGWNGGDSFQGYLKLYPGSESILLEKSFPGFLAKYVDIQGMNSRGFFLDYKIIPLTKASFVANPQLKSIILLLFLLGTLLLGLVFFNTVMLSISQHQKMKNELHIRRIFGFSHLRLYKLMFQDALFQFFLSLILSAIVAWYIAPLVLSNFNINLKTAFATPLFLILLAGVTAILFIASFFIPAQRSLRKIKHRESEELSVKGSFVADLPLALQVGISFSLLVFFWYIFQQLAYIQEFDKGYVSDNLVYIELNNEALFSRDQLLKNELEQIRGVESVCLSDDVPLYGLSGNSFSTEPGSKNLKIFRNLYADEDFFNTLRMEVTGPGFSRTSTDKNSVIITELVAKELGFEDPLYKSLYPNGGSQPFTIMGIVPDLLSGTLHSEKDGIVFNRYSGPDVYSTLTVRIEERKMIEAVKEISTKINQLIPDEHIQIKYYDMVLKESYQLDYALKMTISFFAIIASILTIAGLVGFSVSSMQKRTKEISIRKVVGAGEWSLVLLLNRSFLIKSVISLVIFSPLSWWMISAMMNNYAYHVPVRPVTFIALSLLIIAVVLSTIYLAVRNTVKRNPVETLRYE